VITRRAGVFLVCVALLAPAARSAAQTVPNLERGRALYENHCVVCHTSKVHRRYPPSAIDMEALRFIVNVWVEERKLAWGPEEVDDVVYYLDRVHYRFEK
jgi:mono/diheme cytochrome c family protein